MQFGTSDESRRSPSRQEGKLQPSDAKIARRIARKKLADNRSYRCDSANPGE
jgi:hypothetical protein